MKKFFKGLALDVKFSRAGEGHRLDASESSKEKQKTSSKPSSTPSQPPSRPSEASMVAGAMTVERIEKQHQQQHASSRTKTAVSNTGKPPNTSRNSPPNSSTKKTPEETNVTRPSTTSSRAAGEAALARLERQQSKEEEKKRSHVKRHSVPESSKSQPPPGGSSPRTQSQRVEANPINVSVHLVCPNCERIELYSEMDRHLENCLQEVYLKDPVYGSVLLIHTLCKNQEKRTTCIDTLCKYLENILEHPDEEKYRKIRISNKAFQDRVAAVKGALLFVEAIGFKQSLLPHGDGEEQFYVFSEEDCPDVSSLDAFKELLREAQPVKPTLDRGLKVCKATSRLSRNINLPPDFYCVSAEEIKREQKARSEAIERDQMLLTKAMRERNEVKTILRYYRFVLVRIRTPDNYVLQGTFRPSESLSGVRQFVLSALASEAFPFNLVSTGLDLSDDTATLAELGLAPAVVLNLAWVSRDMTPEPPCLRKELLQNLEEL